MPCSDNYCLYVYKAATGWEIVHSSCEGAGCRCPSTGEIDAKVEELKKQGHIMSPEINDILLLPCMQDGEPVPTPPISSELIAAGETRWWHYG